VIGWLRRRLVPAAPDEVAAFSALLEEAIAAFNARQFEAAEPLFKRVIASGATTSHDREVARNIFGTLLERTRRSDEAIPIYGSSVAERVVGSYPYERLAAIYARHGRYDDQRQVLSHAIAVAEEAMAKGGADLEAPLARLRALLAAASDQDESDLPARR
jgi:hypothetical protein